eukprot:1618283-Rhodomonas_salina.1
MRSMSIFSSTQCDRPPAHGIVMRGNFIAKENEDPWNSRPRPLRRSSQRNEPDSMTDFYRSYGDQKAADRQFLSERQQAVGNNIEVRARVCT